MNIRSKLSVDISMQLDEWGQGQKSATQIYQRGILRLGCQNESQVAGKQINE